MMLDEKYPNLQRCCGGEITTETLRSFRSAMIEYEAYSSKLRSWINGEIDPQTGKPTKNPPLPADLLFDRSGA
ncbi:hypothetical protein SAMN05444050_4252 [Afipia sp. GAS231]|nr:hypothetical protein SAMN05444050_4252 [Afipia sp. GAS231]